MIILRPYVGRDVSEVPLDDSPQLRTLVDGARSLRHLSFKDKLPGVKKLVLDSMANACEAMLTDPDHERRQICREIVEWCRPLSYALEQRAGCCRYQGALLFVLGYEADLGDRHFIQYARVSPRTLSVFNDVFDGGELYRVSVFFESLADKSLDYTSQNPRLFDDVVEEREGETFFSYHRQHDGELVMVANPTRHIRHLPEIPQAE